MGWIERRYGSGRGAIRLLLTRFEQALGRAGELPPDPRSVKRLVFVCHGNICRSAYADVFARDLGFDAASFGLSTTSGAKAHPPIVKTARLMGVDLSTHRATAVADFEPRPGDLLLAMESRHLRRLATITKFDGIPRLLLGRFADWPHLHDPYEITPDYTAPCLHRIDQAVRTAARAFPGATLS